VVRRISLRFRGTTRVWHNEWHTSLTAESVAGIDALDRARRRLADVQPT
jgi:hypothetical protein